MSVTINVTDENESPTRPGRPTVSAIAGSTSSVRVTWDAPSNEGRPPIVTYDVQYRTGGGSFTPWSHDGTDTSTIITDLSAGTSYEVQVKAWNMEDDSEWSPSGAGMPNPDVANRVPAFSGGARTLNIVENTPPNTDVGTPIAAIDRDGDTLTYTLEGTDADSFDILSTSDGGQIRTSAELNFEEKSSYSATVRVTDGRGGTDAVGVTIMVTDVDGEAPATPLTPTVTAISSTRLQVSWEEPENTGPPITDYDYRYRNGSASWTEVTNTTITGTTVTIERLTASTFYDVQVRATNDEGIGPWSESGTGSTSINNPPTFSSVTTSRSVAENTAAGENIGSPVTATDDDPDDTLTYTLSGLDASSFSINDETGQLMTGTPLDYEVKRSYTVTVTASDGTDSDEIQVTIDVIDVLPPSAPSAPTVEATMGSTTSLDVSWDEPVNTGPAITDYDVQYRAGSSGGFRDWPHAGTVTTATIIELTAGTSYEVQVRATNDEDTGPWSGSGRGVTRINNPPAFSSVTTTRAVAENTAAGENIGSPVTADDDDPDDTLTYTLSGLDASSFSINDETGQLMTGTPLDYEVKRSYTVTVTASDGTDSDEIQVTIDVIDVLPPSAPSAPTVEATMGSTTSLDVSWDELLNTGPAITDYDYQYKETSSSTWTVVDNTTITATAITISLLNANTSYDMQVRATNDEGTGEWSGTGTGSTSESVANRAPVFSEGASTTRTVSESAQASSPVGAPVTATDADNDTLVYSLDGTDASSFDITSSGGQLLVGAGTVLDASTKSTYSVTVVANDGSLDARITVTITVTPTNRAPVFSEGGTATRSVREDAASGTAIGSPVTATDADPGARLTYRVEGTDAGSFTINTANGQLLTSAALDADTKATYTVDVVASDGSLEARITVTITVTALPTSFGCATRGAVSDASNTGLVSDCEALLDARDVLVGLGSPLNWSASTPIAQWDGVTVDGTPMRVTTLDLRKMRLKGVISSDLSRVTALKELYLQDNHLTGPIPSELGSMTALTHLYAGNNDLSGAIPSQMGSMTELSQLRLRSNDLSGPLPAALGSLTNLTYLLLSDNDLSGSIPSQIGDMSSLYWLDVGQNNISGTLPAELGNLSQLGRLYVYENDLTGSIPSTLGNLTRLTHIVAQENDLSGSIPVQLGNMSALVWMGLYDNDLSGAIPTQLSRLSNLQRLYLSNNDLTGTIPRELGQLSALTDLWLDDNGLSGTIPSELDQLTNLVRWRMRGNDFTGCVPAGLAAVRSTDFDQLGLPVCSGS